MRALLCLLLLACSSASVKNGAKVDGAEAKKLVAEGALLLDVRSQEEFDDEHILGATNIPVNELQAKLASLPKDKPIVVYCAIGGRATKAAAMLADAGYSVRNLGGMASWPDKTFPQLTIDAVAELLGKPGVYFYDANPKEMYDRGHLPGAKWVEWNKVSAKDLPADHSAQLVFYCANEHCTASPEAARLAAAEGYTKVALMPRGILGWKKANKQVETTP